MRFRIAALALLMTAFSTEAFCDPASDLWTQGKYEAAVKAGVSENTPEGLAFAARAAVSDMVAHPTPCMDCINRAEELSRKALAADPKGATPTLCLAAALDYRGHVVGLLAAQSARLGEQSEQAIKDAMAVHPKDAHLLAAMGGWDFEVVRFGGSLLARWTYGATVDEGMAKYDEAFRLAPDDLLDNYQYGLELAAYDPDAYRGKIEAAWKRAAAAPSDSAFDDMQKKRAAELLALLDGNDRAALHAKLNSYMGIPD